MGDLGTYPGMKFSGLGSEGRADGEENEQVEASTISQPPTHLWDPHLFSLIPAVTTGLQLALKCCGSSHHALTQV